MKKGTFIFLFTSGLIFRILFSFLIPDFTGNDEPAHLRYAQHILSEKKLPNLNNYTTENPAGNEYFQPPLYYLFLTPLITLNNNPSMQLHIARIFSIIIWAIGFYIAYRLIIRIRLQDPHSTTILSFLALLPTYVANSSTVNNDSLTITLSIAALLCFTSILNQKITFSRLLSLSIIISATVLTKMTGLILLPAAIWLITYKAKGINKKFITNTTILMTLTILITGSWFLYNSLTYQNLLDPIESSTVTFTKIPLGINKLYLVLRGTFFTFWAAYGQANQIRLPQITYLLLLLLTIFPILGFCLSIYKVFKKKAKLPIDKKYIYPLLIVLVANILLLLSFNIYQHQPLGRYLFPSLFSIALFWSIGLNYFFPRVIQKHIPIVVITILFCLNFLGIVALGSYY